MKTWTKVLTAVIFISSTTMLLADEKTVSNTTTTTTTVTQAPAMTPEQQAMMARMNDYTTVTEKHELLKSMAGIWKTDAKFWMAPNTPPEESQGTSENVVIMDGRFLEQNFNGTAMGKPFEGRGFLGYDNMRKEYTSIWFDNMATGIMTGTSQYNPQTKTLTEEGSMSCPISNETHRWYKAVTTFIDPDHYKYETYMKDEKGQEFKGMEINYNRAK
jgi:hypothetical protein